MPIVANELKYYESTNNLGGAFVATEIVDNVLHNLFDVVESSEAEVGAVNYRCIYLKNTNLSLVLANALVYIQSDTPYAKSTLGIGLGTSAINDTEQTIIDETTAPIGVTFNEAVGSEFGLLIGDLPANTTKALWLRRTIAADSNATTDDTCSIGLQGDTAG